MTDLFIEAHDLVKILLLREILNMKLHLKGINFENRLKYQALSLNFRGFLQAGETPIMPFPFQNLPSRPFILYQRISNL